MPTPDCVSPMVAGHVSLVCDQPGLGHWLSTLSDFATRVVSSDVIVSGLVAATVSILGVLAANRSSLRRLKEQHVHDLATAAAQHAHDARQNSEDRKSSFRREVYLEAVAAAHACIGATARLSSRPLSKSGTDDEGFQTFLTANAKIWLVAESKASHLSREVADVMGKWFFAMLKAAKPLRENLAQIQQLDDRIAEARPEIDHLRGMLREELKHRKLLDSIPMPPRVFIQDELSRVERAVKALEARKEQLALPGRHNSHIQCMLDTRTEFMTMQKKLIQLVCSLRTELDLPADEEHFMSQLLDTEKLAFDALSSLDPNLVQRPPGNGAAL